MIQRQSRNFFFYLVRPIGLLQMPDHFFRYGKKEGRGTYTQTKTGKKLFMWAYDSRFGIDLRPYFRSMFIRLGNPTLIGRRSFTEEVVVIGQRSQWGELRRQMLHWVHKFLWNIHILWYGFTVLWNQGFLWQKRKREERERERERERGRERERERELYIFLRGFPWNN